MATHRAAVLPLSLVMAAWAFSAAALDRDGAIDAAKRQVKAQCTSVTPCTFTAKPQKDKWHVFVQFTKRNSPQEKAFPYPGGHAILIVDQTGKVVGRLEGE